MKNQSSVASKLRIVSYHYKGAIWSICHFWQRLVNICDLYLDFRMFLSRTDGHAWQNVCRKSPFRNPKLFVIASPQVFQCGVHSKD